jgi:hypothetical protein
MSHRLAGSEQVAVKRPPHPPSVQSSPYFGLETNTHGLLWELSSLDPTGEELSAIEVPVSFPFVTLRRS